MQPLTPEEIKWIDANRTADCARLRLASRGDSRRGWLITQIECRRRAAAKIPAETACEAFVFPHALSAEQSTGDLAAAYHAALVPEGSTVLDMTAGLGIDAFHVARRASAVTAVDINADAAEALRLNAAALGLDNVEPVCADSVEWLAGNSGRHFDVIFIDPARRGADGARLYALSDCAPDVTAILPLLLERCGRLIVKASPMLDISAVVKEVGHGCDVVALGTVHECKELVITVPGSGLRGAVTVTGDGDAARFEFTQADESAADAPTADARAGDILYVPWPSAVKSGAFNLLALRHGVAAIACDTHLYVGPGPADDRFPGDAFAIIEVTGADKRSLRALRERYPDGMSVSVRNFTMTAVALTARLKLPENSDRRLFAVRDAAGSQRLIVAGRLRRGASA